MALYVYQGFWQDCLVEGGSVVWPDGVTAGSFLVFLIQDNVNLDTNQGLARWEFTTWAQLDANTAIAECSHQNYTRFTLPSSARSTNWDDVAQPNEIELQYDNATTPITWIKLGQGEGSQDIGAYLICRDAGGGVFRLWMADSGATGLPATTNGEDLTLTLNTEGFLKGYQPFQN